MTGTVHTVTPLVHLLIAVFNNSAISGAITNCTHGVTHITSPVKIPQNINTREKRLARDDILENFSLVMIFWGISTGDDSARRLPATILPHTSARRRRCAAAIGGRARRPSSVVDLRANRCCRAVRGVSDGCGDDCLYGDSFFTFCASRGSRTGRTRQIESDNDK